jgi:putative flavoprotein involved in K+ transport
MADYLEGYAAAMRLPIELGKTVESVWRDPDCYLLRVQDGEFKADNVIVAASVSPYTPDFATGLDPEIVQLHSSEYLRPGQLRDGGVLVVGAGNSGADIALELARTRRTWLSGEHIGSIPIPAQHIFWYWWMAHHRIIVDTAYWHLAKSVAMSLRQASRGSTGRGRNRVGKAQAPVHGTRPSAGTRLVRVRLHDLTAAGVEIVPRTCGVENGLPVLRDNQALNVANVIWCTGFRPDYPRWIHLPVFTSDGMPDHDRGVVSASPGLYFVGRPYQRTVTSDLIIDMSKHTEFIVTHLVSRSRRGSSTRMSRSARLVS